MEKLIEQNFPSSFKCIQEVRRRFQFILRPFLPLISFFDLEEEKKLNKPGNKLKPKAICNLIA